MTEQRYTVGQTLTKTEAISMLAVFEHKRCEGCEKELYDNGFVVGHASHAPNRRTVHSMSIGGGFALGADWDESGVLEWLDKADHIAVSRFNGHRVAAHAVDTAPPGVHNPRDYERPKWYVFETSDELERMIDPA